MEYQIFICYRRDGGEALAYLIHEHLKASGYRVFYDVESLSSGKFNTKLFEMIDMCTDVLVILPPNALERCSDEEDWLRLEISHALKKGKNIIPVMMRGFLWPDSMPEDIYDLKHYNGVSVSFDFFESVLERIEKCLMVNSANMTQITGNSGEKRILLWGDFDNAYLEKIVKKLNFSEEYAAEILDDPVELLAANTGEVDTIILIVTDCTKLSNNSLAIERINDALCKYVKRGGKLICAHDVIYRRTRNLGLQKMWGGQITNFKLIEKVHYKKTENCKEDERFLSLPDEFDLHDAEICWGNIADDIDVYFESEEGAPLVFSREYGRGICIYFNSGDFRERPPLSISKPEKEFVALLREAVLMEY